VVVDLQLQRPELISLFSSDQWIRDSRSNDYRYFFSIPFFLVCFGSRLILLFTTPFFFFSL